MPFAGSSFELSRRALILGGGAGAVSAGCWLARGSTGAGAMSIAERRVPDFADVPYVEGGTPQQMLDIYLPAGGSGGLAPVVLWIHGGGWVGGNKSKVGVSYLLDDGYGIVSIEYRLLQDAMFPAQIQDANAAFAWLYRNAERYGFDPAQIVVGGSSAGGRSASIIVTSANNGISEFRTPVDGAPIALIDFFGGTEAEYSFYKNRKRMALIESQLSEEEIAEMMRLVDVRNFVDGGDPPSLIVHGDADRTVPVEESRKLVQTMRDVGVDVTYKEFAGRGHGIEHFQDDETRDVVRSFLADHISFAG